MLLWQSTTTGEVSESDLLINDFNCTASEKIDICCLKKTHRELTNKQNLKYFIPGQLPGQSMKEKFHCRQEF